MKFLRKYGKYRIKKALIKIKILLTYMVKSYIISNAEVML